MTLKRLISDDPLVDSQESHQERNYKDVFMDGDWSSHEPPSSSSPFPSSLLSYPSLTFTCSMHKKKKIN
ncbi:hypothetical protein E2C01_030364 [Portunus trituberculatus]|uniref:Uncharacterized protein n=1 Tax=Portunus trituberculatus TaxID=210409 RepID=A0A5B7EU24_PORTR|nr:hypothetical protein [Portunus trituberculatus]